MDKVCNARLVAKLRKQVKNERRAIRVRQANSVLGPSVVRVFCKNSKSGIRRSLGRMHLERLAGCHGQTEFDRFFYKALSHLDKAIMEDNSENDRILPGHKWGHAAKVLCLYLRGIVLHTRYFDDRTAKRLKEYLYLPVDRVVLNGLRELDCSLPSRDIKSIDTKAKFKEIQDIMTVAAKAARAPRVLFDDIWVDAKL